MPFTGYSLNDIPLHDQARGWKILRDGTSTQGGITNSLNKVSLPGRPGYNPAPSTYTEQAVILTLRCTRAGLEPLLVLCAAATELKRTDDATKVARVQLASAIPTSDAPLDSMFDVTITLIIPDGAWRDVDFAPTVSDGTQAIAITTPTQAITALSGLAAPVFDALVFVRGVFGQFTLTDSGGSFLKTTRSWPGTATTGLLYNGLTNQAFFANDATPFVPVSDASQYIDVSGNGGFRLTPSLVSGNPAVRQVSLSIVTLSQTSTAFRIRAKRAYRMN